MTAAIRVENLGKRYRIGLRRQQETLREHLSRLAHPLRRRRQAARESTLWALRNVSLEILPGEVVGIIGPNGSGKTTLLKVLSRITRPTEGRALLSGRVGTLLEVGTGFHPELTGRENVYLNGAILGMRRHEIRRRFDEIVAFSEIERFLDTPVKRYSSGMYVRLAFSVAAHLDPEILIVDEVLAVGDSRFQRKCLGVMGDVARSGRTVLFVSHNMGAIQSLCPRAVRLDGGRLAGDGPAHEVVAAYLATDRQTAYRAQERTGKPQVLEVSFQDQAGRPLQRLTTAAPFAACLRYVLPHPAPGLTVGIGLLTADGLPLLTVNSDDAGQELPGAPGIYRARIEFPAESILVGDYHLAVAIWTVNELLDWQEPALTFAVDAGASPLYVRQAHRKGYLHLPTRWRVDRVGED